jgi:hypothetical protein
VNRSRSKLLVELDLDPAPGWGNTPEDHRSMLQRYLDDAVPHYRPNVTIVDATPTPVCIPEFGQDPNDCTKHSHVPGLPVRAATPVSRCSNDACLCHRGGVS